MVKPAFAHVSQWVFDLDNTLYPPQMRLFDQIEVLMTDYVVQAIGVDRPEADRLRSHYWRQYNPRTNWRSRCFTIEYNGWFRVVLPGIARLGLVVPLGGTTFFFRREKLLELGGWDAHNVTEDADQGVAGNGRR